jgi:acetyl esterase/lipase
MNDNIVNRHSMPVGWKKLRSCNVFGHCRVSMLMESFQANHFYRKSWAISLIWLAFAASPSIANAGPPPERSSYIAVATQPATNAADVAKPMRSSLAPDRKVKVERDVVYGSVGEEQLKMDIFIPGDAAKKPLPVAVYVHGGGWEMGDKSRSGEAIAIPELVKRGYLVASINYRLAPKYKFPAQIEDAKCAIRFLRASAATYELDPMRIGVLGDSAGGHLVALLGLTDAKAGFEGTGGYPEQSSKVQAVVDMFGPTDLAGEFGDVETSRIAKSVFGAANIQDAVIKSGSPVTYVNKSAPPFLILQGDKDRLVPLEQSKELHDRLTAAGGSSTLVIVKNAGHGFVPMGGQPEPSRLELSRMIADFFDKSLRK